MSITGKTILITGAARRLGREIALEIANQGANVILHYNTSKMEVDATAELVKSRNVEAWTLPADLSQPHAASDLINAAHKLSPIDGLINNASLFLPVDLFTTTEEVWDQHFRINLTSPFILTQKFAEQFSGRKPGRIINMLDWRALRPGIDHFPYTISKAGLAAFTQAAARRLAPDICVNAIALGAILPPENEPENSNLIKSVPMQRWSSIEELTQTVLFFLDGPEYITGEIIHLDGGRHLV